VGTYRVIHDVSLRLRALLSDALPPKVSEITGPQHITLAPPQNVTAPNVTGGARVSLWLYQVVENATSKNQPMLRGTRDEDERFPPLALNLLYLLTPNTGSFEADQYVLGVAMQTFHDHARLVVRSTTDNRTIADEISIVLAPRTLEELTRVWDALREPYRLSVCYEVRLVRIESLRESRAARIGERELGELVPA
jgi:hypothetical protein